MLAFITANVSTISLFFPAVLSDCFDFATSVLSNPRDYSRTESPPSAITAELTPASVQSLLEGVSKRVQSVKKRIERSNQSLNQFAAKPHVIEDFRALQSRQIWIVGGEKRRNEV